MGALIRAVFVVMLLAVPLVVIGEIPRLLDLASSVPSSASQVVFVTPTPGFRLADATPSSPRSRFASLDETPPPTLAPPAMTATPVATARPTPTGERIMIGNTGGQGAVLRADPVTGAVVASLHEQQVLDVLERRSMPGNGDWVRVRTADGREGWVTGLVALPAPSASP
ncbi:MAG TPA: SH3 domain-containing protein [Chloroflexota bacterium]